MRNRVIGSIFTGLILAAVAVLATAPAAVSQTSGQQGGAGAKSQSAASTPDLSGVWMAAKFDLAFTKEEPPMQPWAAEKFKSILKVPKDQVDPDEMRCSPPGPTRALTHRYPLEFVQVPGRVIMFFEYDHITRQVYLDGREHPKGVDLVPTWMGHSIGKWDGDTLVVDTVGVNDKTWLDELGHPHSDALHVVERIRRVDHNTLVFDLTFDDPKAYTRTWTAQKFFKLHPDWEITEHVCADNFLWHPEGGK